MFMRLMYSIAAALVLFVATPALAQEWDEQIFVEDGFKVNFPGKPTVENTTWETQYRYKVPARIYRASRGQERYQVTVADYRPLEKMGPERAKQCPPGAETCIGTQDGRNGGVLGLGYWRMDYRGAMLFALAQLLRRPGVKLTDATLQFQDLVEGYMVQLENQDGSKIFAYITMHEGRLYVYEGTSPKGAPEPGLFINSVGFVDAKGQGIRYTEYYSPAVHGLRQQEPPTYRAGGQLIGPGGVVIPQPNQQGGQAAPAAPAAPAPAR
jgi:hypothetical protein